MEILLRKFGLPKDIKLENYNLIGFDFGDGMLSAYRVARKIAINPEEKDEYEFKNLYFDENLNRVQAPNAIIIDDDEVFLVVTEKHMANANDNCYYNFKRNPCDGEIETKYEFDNLEESDYTYKEIMQKAFRVAMECFFKNNEILDEKKETIVLVGRPGNKGWEHAEKKYAKLLEQAVEGVFEKKVYVAVASEAISALARETQPSLREKRIKANEIVLIMDLGSSTFDAVVITPKGIGTQQQDSYQFGGNKLDKILLEQLKREIDENELELLSENGHKLVLRIKKELYFNTNGCVTGYKVNVYPYRNDFGETETEYDYILDKKKMNSALTKEPTTYKYIRSLEGIEEMIYVEETAVNSWVDGCNRIFNNLKERFQQDFGADGTPDRIILTGGVSEMQIVQKLVEACFGVKPTVTEKNQLSVAEGLAYMLSVEMRKEAYIDELMEAIIKEFPSEEKLREVIADVCVENVWNWHYKSLEKTWNSYGEWCIAWCQSPNYYMLNEHMKTGSENYWNDAKLEDKINQILKEKFEKMFPDYKEYFTYKVDQNKILEKCTKTVEVSWLKGAQTRARILFNHKEEVTRFFFFTKEVDAEYQNYEKLDSYKCKRMRQEMDANKSSAQNVMRNNIISEINIEDSTAMRQEMIDLLREQIVEYVETITPYFVRTHV